MKPKFAYQIIDGFRRTSDRNGSSTSAGQNHLLERLLAESSDNQLSVVLEACQKRLDALIQDRSRVGRHLHNHVLRPLFAITANFPNRNPRHMSNTATDPTGFNRSSTQLRDVIQELRRIIRELEDGAVQEFDLVSELYQLIKSYEPLGHLIINLSIPPEVPNLLTLEEKREVFNITREAVNNCVRHAQATRAIIKLNYSKARIRLAIIDNGMGFIARKPRSAGYGLPNMKTRAERLGGGLHVRSQKGRGTTIIADFALEPMLVRHTQ